MHLEGDITSFVGCKTKILPNLQAPSAPGNPLSRRRGALAPEGAISIGQGLWPPWPPPWIRACSPSSSRHIGLAYAEIPPTWEALGAISCPLIYSGDHLIDLYTLADIAGLLIRHRRPSGRYKRPSGQYRRPSGRHRKPSGRRKRPSGRCRKPCD